MALSDLSSSQLQQLIPLLKEKESLQAQLDQVNHSIAAVETGTVSSKGSASPGNPPVRRLRRTRLKDKLLKVLQAAGKDGLTVKELAASLNAKPASVSVWFYTTGKKVKGIKRVGPAKFAYRP